MRNMHQIHPRLCPAAQQAFRPLRRSLSTQAYPRPLYLIETNDKLYGISMVDPAKLSRVLPKALVGWVPKETAPEPSSFAGPSPRSFLENKEFQDVLHSTLEKYIHLDVHTQDLARHQNIGHLNINDQRVFSPWGRVSDPEDIFGTVLLDQGRIVPGSYQRTGSHRVVSREGLFQLSDYMYEQLLGEIRLLR
ncbi:uncharacterized protein BJ171DRAFT_53351 [Polychytrium aggregatum]|uniref:uncharacterized protein n=1 Tax=Polychytrium aggregatum TaxID=110093 RepID=UPI0022FEE41E|nr:uncharacterized protein BJ171DRAFT_53351 [Polychytrium aggregatum]KAI9205815.1 hypothetical protein BJ171DRAFT_53351 [Polychytrium aggregatum]